MAIKNRKELFVRLLSNFRHNTDRSSTFWQEVSQLADDPRVKEAMEARSFVNSKIVSTIDQCFKFIGEQPIQSSGRLQEVFLEDFRRELGEIQEPEAKRIFVLSKINHLIHLRIGELVALVAAADMTGNFGVGVLLESCLADKVALAERTRRLIRNIVEAKIEAKAAKGMAA